MGRKCLETHKELVPGLMEAEHCKLWAQERAQKSTTPLQPANQLEHTESKCPFDSGKTLSRQDGASPHLARHLLYSVYLVSFLFFFFFIWCFDTESYYIPGLKLTL